MSSGSGPQASSREQGSQPGSNKRPNSIHCGRKRRKGVVLRNTHDQTKPARTTTARCTTQELPLYLPPPTSWRGITHRPALAGNAEFQIFLLSSPCKGKMHQVLAHLLTDHLPIFETKYKRTFSRLNYFVGGGKKQFWNHEALSYETQLKQKSKNLQGDVTQVSHRVTEQHLPPSSSGCPKQWLLLEPQSERVQPSTSVPDAPPKVVHQNITAWEDYY